MKYQKGALFLGAPFYVVCMNAIGLTSSPSFYECDRAEQKRFYDSKAWKQCRAVYLSEHPCCERCEKAGIVSIAVHVHHKQHLTAENYKNPMIALNPDNLEALCFRCHQKEHHSGREIAEELYFDSFGNVKHI